MAEYENNCIIFVAYWYQLNISICFTSFVCLFVLLCCFDCGDYGLDIILFQELDTRL